MEGEPEILVFDEPAAVAAAAASTIAAALGAAAERRGRADWLTTGGSTPLAIYRALAAGSVREGLPWDRIHVWWGDDRYVPRDDPASNVRILDEVVGPVAADGGPGLPLPAAGIHPPDMAAAIASDAGVEDAAAAYERALRASALATGTAGFPAFDVVLVGIGPDGHLLSVFPGSALLDSDAWVAAVPAPTHVDPHLPRVSLNPGVLDDARLLLAVAYGAAKAPVLADIFGPERDPRRWPAQLARRPGARWLLDRAAAAALPPGLTRAG